MTRMSREFTLVLLGAGLLTAGYLAYPEPDIDKNAETAAAKRVGGDGTTRRSGGGMLVFIHSSGGGYSASGTSGRKRRCWRGIPRARSS